MDENLQKPTQEPVEPQTPPIQETPPAMPPPEMETKPTKKASSFSVVSIVVIILAIGGYIALASFYDFWPF